MNIPFNVNEHQLQKQNLVSKFKKGLGYYDEYVCTRCKIKIKRINLSDELDVDKRYEKQKVMYCTKGKPSKVQDDMPGVWVMGVGEPVKLLFGEYRVLEWVS